MLVESREDGDVDVGAAARATRARSRRRATSTARAPRRIAATRGGAAAVPSDPATTRTRKSAAAVADDDAGRHPRRAAGVRAGVAAPRWPMYVRQAKQFLKTGIEGFDERKYGFASVVDLLRAAGKEGVLRSSAIGRAPSGSSPAPS